MEKSGFPTGLFMAGLVARSASAKRRHDPIAAQNL
jgi:hypothetical protein